jgi:cell fate regulator YaaT (PSP1 superfamily)
MSIKDDTISKENTQDATYFDAEVVQPADMIDIQDNDTEYIEVEMRTWKILYFNNPMHVKVQPDDYVICEVDRGQDIGRVLHTSMKSKDISEHITHNKQLTIIRCATEIDFESMTELYERERLATDKFLETLARYNFEMKLLDTVFQFDGNKVTFFFTADGRIDFRDFVRELAKIFKTRVELHQSTGRDEAKKLGGFGMCGNIYCCSSFLKRFNQVTIKMAKDQNLSGNLSKISGPCGRLLCCLNFEEDYYSDNSKEFPEMGDEVWYSGKKMYVYRNDIDAKTVYLTSDTQEITTISIEDYKKIKKKKKSGQADNKADCDECHCKKKDSSTISDPQ